MEKLKLYCRKSVITPLVTLGVLIVFVVSMLRVAPPVEDGSLSESFFPVLIFLAGAPAAILLFFDALRTIRKEQPVKKEPEKRGGCGKIFLVAALILFLALTFEPLGYAITAPVFVFLFMLIYDDKPQKIIQKIIYTLLITVFVYILYGVIFDVRFPQPWR
jgi:hypothetical protein